MPGGRRVIGKERSLAISDADWQWLADVAGLSDADGNRSEILRRCIALARQLQADDPARFYSSVMHPEASPSDEAPSS